MIMITNSFNLLPNSIFHLHRVLQCLIGLVLIVSTWHHHTAQLLVIVIYIAMNLHQSLVLFFHIKTNITLGLKITLTIVFVDGIVTGLLIQCLGGYHSLSIALGGLFLLVYFKTFSLITYSAIIGVVTAIFTANQTHIPSCNLETSTEILLFVMMSIFLIAFCTIRSHQDKTLNEKLALQFEINKSLKLHVHRLSKYLSPKLSKFIIANNTTDMLACDKPMTIFFSDMQGFSQLSEQLDSNKLSWMVNSFLSEMTDIALSYDGTLDKMIGDSIMVFFGDPTSFGKQNDAVACVSMAIAMREAMNDLHLKWQKAGINNPPNIRMGINTGSCRVGNFGTPKMLNYTVVGSCVNLASYLESIAQPNEILISEHTYNLVKDHVQCRHKKILDYRWLSKDLKIYAVEKMISGHNFSADHSRIIDNL
jgi:adenylate cyclase